MLKVYLREINTNKWFHVAGWNNIGLSRWDMLKEGMICGRRVKIIPNRETRR
jgi:hypothetical protein